jgi:hypothetical protein
MSTLVKVYYRLLADISRLSGVLLDLPDDFDEAWILHEGPKLDKDVLQYLEGNRLQQPEFPPWLQPLWESFISGKEVESILRMLRTILVFGYKAEHEPSKDQLANAVEAFASANLGVRHWSEHFLTEGLKANGVLFREAQRLVSRVVSRGDYSEVIPKHGPGAVFPPHSPCNKGNFNICTPIIEYYPYDKFFNCLPLIGSDDLNSSGYTEYGEIHARLTAVPKDSRGPRLICVHPKESIWIQQGQRTVLESSIENHPLTRGRVNFRDQGINGSLALSSSLDRSFCTIDLKEASDRVSKDLVDYLFGYTSKLLSCSRASHIQLLDGTLLELYMWAPMGNCLTFPVESLVFWSLARAGILCRHGQHCDDIYVFGDDIIVPEPYYEGAIYGLVSAGLIPNFGKTFRKGFFRESCGVDAYNGKDVTPFRMKVRGIASYSDAESACDLAKRLRRAGYCDTSAYLYRCVSRRFRMRLSLTNNPDCQGLIEYTDYDIWKLHHWERKLRFNRDLHRWEVPYHRRVRTVESIRNHAWWHVQDSLLSLERKLESTSRLDCPWEKHPPTVRELYNDRRLEYPSPRGERLHRGWSPVMAPALPWVIVKLMTDKFTF